MVTIRTNIRFGVCSSFERASLVVAVMIDTSELFLFLSVGRVTGRLTDLIAPVYVQLHDYDIAESVYNNLTFAVFASF